MEGSSDKMVGSSEWPDDYELRKASLILHGLCARVRLSEEDGFVSLRVKVLKGQLLRETPWKLHVTLGFTSEIAPAALRRLRRKWCGRVTKLRFDWVGSGGTGFLHNCAASRCRLVRRAHEQGYYRDRELHISF